MLFLSSRSSTYVCQARWSLRAFKKLLQLQSVLVMIPVSVKTSKSHMRERCEYTLCDVLYALVLGIFFVADLTFRLFKYKQYYILFSIDIIFLQQTIIFFSPRNSGFLQLMLTWDLNKTTLPIIIWPQVFGFALVRDDTNYNGYDWDQLTTLAWNDDPRLMCLAHAKGARVVLDGRSGTANLSNATARSEWVGWTWHFLTPTILRPPRTFQSCNGLGP